MATAVRASAKTTSTGIYVSPWQVTVPKPTGTAVGDVLLVIASGDDVDPASITGSTFTQLFSGSPTNGNGMKVWKRVVDGTEPTSFTITYGTPGADISVVALALQEVNTSAQVVGAFGNAATGATSISIPAITTTAANSLVLAIADVRQSTSTTPVATSPSGFTKVIEHQSDYASISIHSMIQAAAGTTGAEVVTYTPAGSASGLLLAFSPVATSDTTAPTVPGSVSAVANSASQVTVSWSASTDAVGVSSYRVRRGGVDLTGATALTGTSFVDTTVAGSTAYSYTVSAVDAAGNRSAESTAATVTTPSAASTLATETWTGTTGAAWPAQWTTTALNGSALTIQGNTGQITAPTGGSYFFGGSALLSGMAAARDFDLVVDVTFSALTEAYYYIGGRSAGGNGTMPNGYYVNMFPSNGANSVGIVKGAGGVDAQVSGDLAAGAWTAGVARRIRFQAIGNDLKFKIWDPAGAEPGTWLWQGTDTTYASTTGKIYATVISGNTADAKNIKFDNLTVTDGATVTAGDTTKPTAPTNVQAVSNAAGTAVTVTWTAGTDAVGVTNHLIIRGENGVYVVWSASPVAMPTTTFTDVSTTPATAYTYQVVARDAAGNESPWSTAASLTTLGSAPAAPATVDAAGTSSSTITVTWSAVSGATKYDIERDSVVVVQDVTGTSWVDTGLAPGSTHGYRVRGVQ